MATQRTSSRKAANLFSKDVEYYEYKFKGKLTKKKIISKFYEDHLCKLEIERKKDFWGFTNNKEFRFIKIVVKSLGLFNSLKYYFQDLKDGFILYESNIEPFLKFIHIQKIKPCGWINVRNYTLENTSDTRCEYNITANWTDIIPIDNNTIALTLTILPTLPKSLSHSPLTKGRG